MPAGSVAIAEARFKVQSLMWGCGWRQANFAPPSIVVMEAVDLPLATHTVYIGGGSFGPAGSSARITQWLNPFTHTYEETHGALRAYEGVA